LQRMVIFHTAGDYSAKSLVLVRNRCSLLFNLVTYQIPLPFQPNNKRAMSIHAFTIWNMGRRVITRYKHI
jgi:hypothetical protein